jgi:serine/threonine protein kinase
MFGQGGLTLATVLAILKQALSAVAHLHSLGILHRDIRAAHLLMESTHPISVVLSAFDCSHWLEGFVSGADPGLDASTCVDILHGEAAAGPLQVVVKTCLLQLLHIVSFSANLFAAVRQGERVHVSGCFPPFSLQRCVLQWNAPEVCAGSTEASTVATTACDVYMVGGLAYELLTGGTVPFHWLAVNPSLFTLRRASRDPVAVPGLRGAMVPGLYGKSVLEVAAEDGVDVPWCVRVDGSPGSAGRLEALKAVVSQCLAADPGGRPKVAALLETVGALLEAEVAETGHLAE